ncbi:hypothetical protein REPUB_Repub09cG0179300 [Reevesia pubescens]
MYLRFMSCSWLVGKLLFNHSKLMRAENTGVATRSNLLPTKDVIGRSEIEAMVRKIMVDKERETIRTRVKTQTLKSCAAKAFSKGGSSYNFSG